MLAPRVHQLRVRTPEGILFSFLLASPVTRFLAVAIDLAAIMAAVSALRIGASFLGVVNPDFATAFQIIAYFAVSIGYGIFIEWYWRGQTLGKRLLRLRVLDERGLNLQFNQILIRNLLRSIDMLPGFYAVGGALCLLTRYGQRLGDIAANTVVVRHPLISEPDLDRLLPDKWNSLRAHPHLSARLRQRVTPRTVALLLEAILRRQDFDPPERLRLFHELAQYFKTLVAYPPEATEGVTDEQYVRNIADVIFRSVRSP
jgi:uncharacterized RDD family membrane protein YckC